MSRTLSKTQPHRLSAVADGTLLTPKETATMLHVALQTLSLWRSNNRYGLRYCKIGRKVMYPRQAVLDFLESRTITHVGELAPVR